MNAINLYVSTCRLVMQADFDNRDSYVELHRLLPCLRQSLSCTVCGKILNEPFTPTETSCQHHVCKLCIGGKKRLKPTCSWCKDYNTYVENCQIKIVIQCYVKLCHFIKNTGIHRKVHMIINNGGHINLSELIDEALDDSNMVCQSELQSPIQNFKCDKSPDIELESEIKVSQDSSIPISSSEEFIKVENKERTPPLSPVKLATESLAESSIEPVLSIETTPSTIDDCLPLTSGALSAPASPDISSPTLSPVEAVSTNISSPISISSSTTCTLSTTSVITPSEPKLVSSLEVPTSTSALLHSKSPVSKVYLSPVNIQSMCKPTTKAFTCVSTSRTFPTVHSASTPKVVSSPNDVRISYGVSLMPADSTSGSSGIPSPECVKLPTSGLYSPLVQTPSVRPLPEFPSLPPASTSAINCLLNIAPGTIFSNASIKSVRDTLIKCNNATINNCSSVYSVMYNDSDTTKFTIKRKPPDIENFKVTPEEKIDPLTSEAMKKKKPKPKPKPKRKGCRCGNATPTPGKLTCCGQRCPCYVAAKACIECQCKGCRNPHRPGGKKVRPIIPQLGNIQIHPVKPVHPRVSSIANTQVSSTALPCIPAVTLHNSIMNSSGVPQTIRAVQAMHAVQAVHGLSQIHTVPGGVHQLLNIGGVIDSSLTAGLNMHPVSDITLKPVNLAISSLPTQLLINDDKSTSNSASDNSDVDVDV